jgi:hypothetical protein
MVCAATKHRELYRFGPLERVTPYALCGSRIVELYMFGPLEHITPYVLCGSGIVLLDVLGYKEIWSLKMTMPTRRSLIFIGVPLLPYVGRTRVIHTLRTIVTTPSLSPKLTPTYLEVSESLGRKSRPLHARGRFTRLRAHIPLFCLLLVACLTSLSACTPCTLRPL